MPAIRGTQIDFYGKPSRGERPDAIRCCSRCNPDALTPGEMAVLELLAQGLDNYEIAKQLIHSKGTIDNRCTQIYKKLHVATRTAAVIEAHRRGLVTLPGPEE